MKNLKWSILIILGLIILGLSLLGVIILFGNTVSATTTGFTEYNGQNCRMYTRYQSTWLGATAVTSAYATPDFTSFSICNTPSTNILQRTFLVYDTSGIPDNAIITAVNLYFSTLGGAYTANHVYTQDSNSGNSIQQADFNKTRFGDLYSDYNWSGGTNAFNMSFTTNVATSIDKTGYTTLVVRFYNDYSGTTPVGDNGFLGNDEDLIKLWVVYFVPVIAINSTSPYDRENYAFQFNGTLCSYNSFWVNATVYQNDNFNSFVRMGFESWTYSASIPFSTIGLHYPHFNLFSDIYKYPGSLKSGYTYDFWFNYSVVGYPIYINESFSFVFNDVSYAPIPLAPIGGSGWDLVSLPKNAVVNKSLIYVRNATQNYTWAQAVTNGVVLNFLYGWQSGLYTLNDTFIPYDGYWTYFYDLSYDLWINTTVPTTPIFLFDNIINAYGFHNYTLNASGYSVYANYTGNYTDPNSTGNWLYLGAMLTLDNGQFFLVILIGLWSYFIYLFYKEKEVIFSFCIICCGLPLGIILSGVAYYNSYPFGYLISFILILISFLIPTYAMYKKNKKK